MIRPCGLSGSGRAARCRLRPTVSRVQRRRPYTARPAGPAVYGVDATALRASGDFDAYRGFHEDVRAELFPACATLTGSHRRSASRPIALPTPPSPGQVALAMRLAAPPGHLRAARWLIHAAATVAANVLPAIRFSRIRGNCASVTNPSSTRKTGSVTCLAGATAMGRSPLAPTGRIFVVDHPNSPGVSSEATVTGSRCG